jgi:hypothetical protein
MTEPFEPFVDADRVAAHLSIQRREVLALTRSGKLTAYIMSGNKRKTFKYKLSEVEQDLAKLRKPSTMAGSSPSALSA